jgi:hypothetical protein
VAATVVVGNGGHCTAAGVLPFLAFSAKLEIDLKSKPNHFELLASFTLSSTAAAINPVTQPVTLKIGATTAARPACSTKTRASRRDPVQLDRITCKKAGQSITLIAA